MSLYHIMFGFTSEVLGQIFLGII